MQHVREIGTREEEGQSVWGGPGIRHIQAVDSWFPA